MAVLSLWEVSQVATQPINNQIDTAAVVSPASRSCVECFWAAVKYVKSCQGCQGLHSLSWKTIDGFCSNDSVFYAYQLNI